MAFVDKRMRADVGIPLTGTTRREHSQRRPLAYDATDTVPCHVAAKAPRPIIERRS